MGIEIRTGGGDHFDISNNLLNMNNITWGLFIHNSAPLGGNDILLSNNHVEAFNGGWRLAFLRYAQNTDFCSNTLIGNDVCSEGLTVSENASGTHLGDNNIQQTNQGLLFFGNGINMGTQYHKGNTWMNGFGNWAAIHNGTDHFLSLFRVNDDLASCGNPNYYPNDSGFSFVRLVH